MHPCVQPHPKKINGSRGRKMLKPIQPDEKIELRSLLRTMEVHQHDKGAVLFWIRDGEDKGGSILLKRGEVERLMEFLMKRLGFNE
jgi:hypothetical protein